jgi:hypothetical protein
MSMMQMICRTLAEGYLIAAIDLMRLGNIDDGIVEAFDALPEEDRAS